MKMKPRVKALWLAALRSKRYLQGKGQLRTRPRKDRAHRYCCLGVLTACYAKAVPSRAADAERSLNSNLTLTPAVIAWAGFESDHIPLTSCGSLSGLNDSGSTFEEIADLIEADL